MKNEELTQESESDFLSVLSHDVFTYLVQYVDEDSLLLLSQTNKQYWQTFEKNNQKYLRASIFKNYALSQGFFANPTFKLSEVQTKLFKHANSMQHPAAKEMTLAVIHNDDKKFSEICELNFSLLEKEILLEATILSLIGASQKKNLRDIVWNTLCKILNIDDAKLQQMSFNLPQLSKLIKFSLYCRRHHHLNFLLKILKTEMYEHGYDEIEKRLYRLFLRYLDTVVELRDFHAIHIIQNFYFQEVKPHSLINEDHYEQAMQNIDIELIAVFMTIEQKIDLSIPPNCFRLPKLTHEHLTKIFQAMFPLALEKYQFHFIVRIYRELLASHSAKLAIDLSQFNELLSPRVIPKMEYLFRFFVHYQRKIEFNNIGLFCTQLTQTPSVNIPDVILHLMLIPEFKSYFTKQNPADLSENMTFKVK